ncbi:MAG TPA: lysoplasmalogenase [Longimicrobium sp.]
MDYAVVVHPERPLYWCAAILASALLTITAEARGWRTGVYVFKPLTTLLVLGLALFEGNSVYPWYQFFVVAGLLFSLAGDVFLMLPRDRFVAGLASFLLAHLCYIGAFGIAVSRRTPLIVGALLLWGFVLLRVLWPGLGRLRVPVIVYAAVLLTMAWQAWEYGAPDFVGELLRGYGWAAPAGATLFVVSDSALAVDRFARPFRHAPALVLATYYAAQTLIALSTIQMW